MMDKQLKQFSRYVSGLLIGNNAFEFANKQNSINSHIAYMLNRTQAMFKWNGLPKTIPERSLELYLQTNGNACITAVNGELYAFFGGLGGEPNPYYMPTVYTVANPALKFSKNLIIDEECIVIPNDPLYIGLLPMFSRYATAMAENELSLNIATINSRLVSLITAQDDRTKESAEKLLKQIADGKQGIIASNILTGINVQPYANGQASQVITEIIEEEQYLKASWYNELGLNANYNMKRESLNSSESQLNNDALLPLIDIMLKYRQEGAEKVNDMYGTNISVELASSWQDNQEEIDLEHEQMVTPEEAPAEPEKEEPENVEAE